ncbi:unnamed protein product, partial [Rotaria sp. Silwood1]
MREWVDMLRGKRFCSDAGGACVLSGAAGGRCCDDLNCTPISDLIGVC